jgi:hypothetical protein
MTYTQFRAAQKRIWADHDAAIDAAFRDLTGDALFDQIERLRLRLWADRRFARITYQRAA